MTAPDAICPILITPFHTTEAHLTEQRAVHAWGKHACTFINHMWVRSTNLSSMMSPGGVGSVFTGTDTPQHGVSSSKLFSNSTKSLSFVLNLQSYLIRIQPASCAQENVMWLRPHSFLSCAHYSFFDLKKVASCQPHHSQYFCIYSVCQ